MPTGCTGSVPGGARGAGPVSARPLLICPRKPLGPRQTKAQAALCPPPPQAQRLLRVHSSPSRGGNPGPPHCFIPTNQDLWEVLSVSLLSAGTLVTWLLCLQPPAPPHAVAPPQLHGACRWQVRKDV